MAFIMGLAVGLFATAAITLTEIPMWRRWAMDGVPEWEMNQALMARLLHRSPDPLVVEGQLLHFLQGGLLGILFAVVVPLLPWSLNRFLAGLAYGLVLWTISLVILKPITGRGVGDNPLGRIPFLGSLLGHLLYGAILGLTQ